MSLTRQWSEADCLSRIVLSHAPRQATVSLTFDVSPKMNFRNKMLLAFATALLSPPVTAWIGDGSISANLFVFSLPVLVLIIPLLIFSLILSDNNHRRSAVVIFCAGMLLYLGYAIYTLGGELMAPLTGNIYIPSIIFMTPFSLYAICHKKGTDTLR